MKKLLTTFGAFIFLLSPSLVFAYNANYTVCGAGDSTVDGIYDQVGSSAVWQLRGGGNAQIEAPSGAQYTEIRNLTNSFGYYYNTLYQSYLIQGVDTSVLNIDTPNEASGPAPTITVGSAGCSAPPPTPTDGLPAQIAAAEQGMASTTGFSIGAVTTWSGDNLIKLFIGSGLGVLYGLRYWIVAMMIIAAITLFSFRAFLFFRH